MKDRLRSILENQPAHIKPGLMREFLQCMVMRSLHEDHSFGKIAFVGGTALRLIYGLPRFSEGLDFSLIESGGFDFTKSVAHLRSAFSSAAIEVDTSLKEKGAVRSLWLKFPRLLHEVGVSSDPRIVLSIKMEIDCNPPKGAVVERRLINRHFPIALVHYDLPSLFAGKLHAVLTRGYVKGRDYYDLVWYRTRNPALEPNLVLLNAALTQTKWNGEIIGKENWKKIVHERIQNIEWKVVVKDVSPFLEDENDIKSMTLEYVLPLFG